MLILVMGFLEAIMVCFKKYATFSGRATRSEFWYFFLFYIAEDHLVFFILQDLDYMNSHLDL